jgi:hypothetical protein
MKKAILFAALAFIVISCKKGTAGNGNPSGANNFHFTANIDGKSVDFPYNLWATRTTSVAANGNETSIGITGYTGAPSANPQGFGISWENLTVGPVFGVATWVDTARAFGIGGVYQPNMSVPDAYESGTNTTGQAFHDGIRITNQMKLIITAYDSSSNPATVTGTFSGDFYDMGSVTTGAKKTIYGDFYVKFK